eukprot:10643668-Ditylum_brightwellii.AAC.1
MPRTTQRRDYVISHPQPALHCPAASAPLLTLNAIHVPSMPAWYAEWNACQYCGTMKVMPPEVFHSLGHSQKNLGAKE